MFPPHSYSLNTKLSKYPVYPGMFYKHLSNSLSELVILGENIFKTHSLPRARARNLYIYFDKKKNSCKKKKKKMVELVFGVSVITGTTPFSF